MRICRQTPSELFHKVRLEENTQGRTNDEQPKNARRSCFSYIRGSVVQRRKFLLSHLSMIELRGAQLSLVKVILS